VEGQGSGPRINKDAGEEEDQYGAMGKAKKISASDARKVSDGLTYGFL
jgi:elongation factor 3